MFDRRTISLAPLAAAIVTGCASMSPAPMTVADTIARQPELSTLNDLVAKAGLTGTLAAPGSITVFAPTNDAFKAVPASTMDQLAKDPARLKAVLTYHVVPSKVIAAQVKNGSVKTAQGANVALSKAGDFVTVEEAMVQRADVLATNGVVHTVDRVLMPPAR